MNFDLILGSELEPQDPTVVSTTSTVSSAPTDALLSAKPASAASTTTADSLATGWPLQGRREKKEKKEKKKWRRRRCRPTDDNKTKHLFPWVSDQWTDLSNEQKRQKKRQGRLMPAARSSVYSTLKGICTLYGAQPGLRCSICNVVHLKSKALIAKETMEDTSGWVDATLRANLKREKRLETERLRKIQIIRMARAADALKWRRRKREKRMQVDPGTFLNDYTDSGGGDINPDMRKAVDRSMKNQGMSKKEKRFRGKLPRRLPMLKFKTDAVRYDEEPGGDFDPIAEERKKKRRRKLHQRL